MRGGEFLRGYLLPPHDEAMDARYHADDAQSEETRHAGKVYGSLNRLKVTDIRPLLGERGLQYYGEGV